MTTIFPDTQLCKGIFWITDIENPNNNRLFFRIPCSTDGNPLISETLNSKSGNSLNHEKTWETLPRNLTGGHPYNNYPRGRVEIAHGKATIFCSPHICTESIKILITEKYNLTEANGITAVRMCADGSAHYRCGLDL